ncbi:PCMD domain-containing protein [Flammeovirga yaeyamensis]|uniref:PCMD domain-containing protein n=1 Tax=Flammeovirga yaeyamensis TaxID=367791 RepID=A0AAX1MZJ8_9BACT|nr:PCMD domain-containing protein [Flammeovirga yaeyamensis]MBB3700934.1 hypothetical protein [Flammeovirga yaeyamensis]NMF38041.1 hypothetical protein [Flammeovirga yaeyamensis]QWG00691.1 PCMD domain-containing protein [Flammeovirga yaeyamensis]
MKLTNGLIVLAFLGTTLFSCSDDDNNPTEEISADFEENLSLDTWEYTEYSQGEYGNPKGWETSNPGTTFLGVVNAYEEKEDVINGSAAKLETKGIGLTGIAAATIYTGKFELNLSDPAKSAQLGVPYTKRPVSMSFNYKYTPGAIYEQYDGALGTTIEGVDSCLVYMYLQKREGDQILRVGTAAMQNSDTVTEWTKRTLDVTYGVIENPVAGFKLREEETGWAAADTNPTHIIVVFTSTSAGDFFRGAIGSTLFVDEISIEY